jgi:hypothetical protein
MIVSVRAGVFVLKDANKDNFVIASPLWDYSSIGEDAGAATWINGTTGKLANGTNGGAISAANSLMAPKTATRSL